MIWIRNTFTAILLAFLIVPTAVVIISSFNGGALIQVPPSSWSVKWYTDVLTSTEWLASIRHSLFVSLVSTVVATIAGVSLALALSAGAFGPRLRGGIELLVIAPMAIPPIELALGGYSLFSEVGLVGSLWALVPLYAVVGLPFVYLSTISVLERLDRRLLMASASLGSGPVRSFFRITLPLVGPAVLTGAALSFVVMLDEVVIALFLLGGESPTLPLRIYSRLTFGVAPDVAAISALQVFICIGGALIFYLAPRRRSRHA